MNPEPAFSFIAKKKSLARHPKSLFSFEFLLNRKIQSSVEPFAFCSKIPTVNTRDRFQAELAKLNPAQRAAVEAIEGPLLIVAGPGTGKTQTVALRLANILLKTQVRPHNLLALTFTNAGAIALKKRLASLIGAEGYGIMALTFHSFAERLMQLFPAEFTTARERTSLDELGKLRVIREILEAGNYPLLRPATAPDSNIRAIAVALSNLKKEAISPEKLEELIARDAAELATLDPINKRTGKKKSAIIDAEKRLARQRELAVLFAEYQKTCFERGFADFDDLILAVVEKLRDPADEFLLAYLQEQFLYVTVDEFQDTNGAQNAILQAWGSYDSQPNLAVVGDDDQSIYRFQGASLANILAFKESYPAAQIVTLTQNYRSHQPILDASRSLIEHNSERLTAQLPGLSKVLESVNPEPGKASAKPLILACGTAEIEAAEVTNRIQALLASGTKPEEIAVLYRRREDGDLPAAYLAQAGVPIYRTDGRDARSDPAVRLIIRLLGSLADEKDAEGLAAWILSDAANLAQVDAFRLLRLHGYESPLSQLLLDFERLETRADELKITFNEKEKISRLSFIFQKLNTFKYDLSLTDLARAVAAESGLAQYLADAKKYESIDAVTAFLGWVRQAELAQPGLRIEDLLAEIRLMEQSGIALPLPQRPHAAVTLATAHGSKGLEWQHVFVIGLADDRWGGRKKGDRLALPSLIPAAADHEILEDERRLLFVAMTRARESLTLTWPELANARPQTPSRFLAEIEPGLAETESSEIAAEAAAELAVPAETQPGYSPEASEFLRSIIENYRLSPSGLNDFLEDPNKFVLKHLLRLPESVNPDDRAGAIFGTALHAALEAWFASFKLTGHRPKPELAREALEKSLRREPMTELQRANISRDAGAVLERYLANLGAQDIQPPLATEFNFAKHEVRLGEIPLTGKVDRIDSLGTDAVRLVDYKSMAPQTRNAIKGETKSSSGNLYRQLLFYTLLAESDPRFVGRVESVALAFLRPNDHGDFVEESFSPSREEIDQLKETIREVWRRIQSLEF